MKEKEIVLLCGIQGSGKSTQVSFYTLNGYFRLNRDEIGGNLASLNTRLEKEILGGENKIVMDNTYGQKEQRKAVIDIAKKYGYVVKCVWIKTSIEDAQFNVSKRMLYLAESQLPNFVKGEIPTRHTFTSIDVNEVLGPNCTKHVKGIGAIPSIALYAYKKTFEAPSISEGFSDIKEVEFEREFAYNYTNKAIIFDYDGTLRDTISGDKYPKSPDDIKILPNRKEILKKLKDQGYLLLGVSNQSGVEKGDLSYETCKACFDKTNELLGFDIDYKFCPHHSFPIRCFCRKPLAGLGVYFIEKYALNPSLCKFVGNATSDKTFAKRCGFQYFDEKDFFGSV